MCPGTPELAAASPENGVALSIGPIEGILIPVARNNDQADIVLASRGGRFQLPDEGGWVDVETSGPPT